MTGRPRLSGLGSRLLAAQLVVVIAGSITLTLVALVVAPPLFTVHLDHAGENEPRVRQHAEEAFTYSLGIALAVAAFVSVATALLVSTLVVRRLTDRVTSLASVADQLAAGHYQVQVPDARLGNEFDRLTDAFTRMQDRLAGTEAVRHRLLSDLAHELRTPVSTLAAHVDGLEDGVVQPTAGTWQTMRDQLDRVNRLAADLSQLSAAEEHALDLHLQTCDLAEIAQAAVTAAAPRYRSKGVHLTGTPHGTATVRADPVRLQQVLGNLLDNALRHTPPQGQVAVVTTTESGYGLVSIRDDGAGIPANELNAIFDRFHRVDTARSRADGGTGLGLTIARAIARAHGGALTAASAGPGTGATFTLRVPRATSR